VRSDLAALLVQLPVERRRPIALEAVAKAMPPMVPCGCDRGMVMVPATCGLMTMTCTRCRGLGSVPVVAP